MAKIPDMKPGDLVKVYSKIVEGDKERIAPFQGVIIQIKGSDIHKTFTVRKISAGIGIERIFPVHSPMITRIEIKKKGKVRRAKLSYLRQRRGRKMKIKESAAQSLETKTDETVEPVRVQPEEKTKAVKEPKPAADSAHGPTGEKKPEEKVKEPSREGTAGQETVEKK
jgi:large subunit ribosomal protein L19